MKVCNLNDGLWTTQYIKQTHFWVIFLPDKAVNIVEFVLVVKRNT